MFAKALITIFIALGLTTSSVVAQPQVYLEAEDSVTFDVEGDVQGVSSYNTLGINRDLNLHLPNGDNPHVHLGRGVPSPMRQQRRCYLDLQ
ncbi:hypothetical protein IAT38_005313 [Cryptococcus sp. DSM 104549]